MCPTKAKSTPDSIARGKRIQEAKNAWLREGSHRTTKQLVGIIGVSEPSYYNWEAGSVDKIAAVNLLNLCRETRFNPFYILWNQKPKRILDDPVIEALLHEMEDYDTGQMEELLRYARYLKSSLPAK